MTAAMHNLARDPLPELAWLPVARCEVDRRYQRSTDSKSSQKLIERIAQDFRWAAFQAVLATKVHDVGAAPARDDAGRWLILDGQHRIEAARRAGITHVPAVVVKAGSLRDQAHGFVAANRDRVAMNSYALYHARLVAGDPVAEGIERVCRGAGVTIPRNPVPRGAVKPGETLALGTIAMLIQKHGEAVAELSVASVAEPWRARPGSLSARVMRGVEILLTRAETPERQAAAVRAELAAIGPDKLDIAVIEHRMKVPSTEAQAVATVIGARIAAWPASRK